MLHIAEDTGILMICLIGNFYSVKSLPIEDYAPDVITISDTTYYMASSAVKKNIYYTPDPFEDNWKPMEKTLPFPVWDPHFFTG